MPITTGYKALLAQANAHIKTYGVAEAIALHGHAAKVFVDIRDPRELEREGIIPGALHATRGMLEFWVDPESPYFKPVFAQEHVEFVLFCGGGWRSALAAKTLQDMGMTNVAHIEGGFAAWKKEGGPVGVKEPRAEHKA
jgi:rhodanese-related sulfurtransferase